MKLREVGLGTLEEPTTEAEPLEGTRPEALLLLTLGIDVDVDNLCVTGGTGVALGERVMFLIVLLFEEDMVVLVQLEQSGIAGGYSLSNLSSLSTGLDGRAGGTNNGT